MLTDTLLSRASVRRVCAALAAANLPGGVVALTASARTVADAALALGVSTGQIAASLVFRLPDGDALLVVTSGRHRVNEQAVAALLQVSSLARADAAFVKAISGYSVGGVAPLGWLHPPARTLVDAALADYPEIWAAAGHPHAVFRSTFADLLAATRGDAAEVGHR